MSFTRGTSPSVCIQTCSMLQSFGVSLWGAFAKITKVLLTFSVLPGWIQLSFTDLSF